MNEQIRRVFDATLEGSDPPVGPDSATVAAGGRRRVRNRRLGWAGGAVGGLAAFAAAALVLPGAFGGAGTLESADSIRNSFEVEGSAGQAEPTDDPGFDPELEGENAWPELSQLVREAFAEHAPDIELYPGDLGPEPLELKLTGVSHINYTDDEGNPTDEDGNLLSEEEIAEWDAADASHASLAGNASPTEGAEDGDEFVSATLYGPGPWEEDPAESETDISGINSSGSHLYYCGEHPYSEGQSSECTFGEGPNGEQIVIVEETYGGSDVEGSEITVFVFREDAVVSAGTWAGVEKDDESMPDSPDAHQFDVATLTAIALDLPNPPEGD